jgi:hypothetical protein
MEGDRRSGYNDGLTRNLVQALLILLCTPLAGEVDFSVNPDGTATVVWQTPEPTRGGCVHYGVFLPDQELAVPRWCGTVFEKARRGRGSKEHRARFSVRRLGEVSRWHDGAPNGTGRVAVRIAAGGERLDRVFGVRWTGGRYRRVAAVVEGPFVCVPTATSLTIALATDLETRASVTIAGPGGVRALFESAGAATRHEIPVSGLFADTTYRYQVRITPADDPALSIACPPARLGTAPPLEFKKPFTFAHLSGSQGGAGGGEWAVEGVSARSLHDLVTLAYRRGADLVLFPGDLVGASAAGEDRFRRELRAWKRVVGPVGSFIPILVTAGSRASAAAVERIFAEEFVAFTNGPEPAAGSPPYEELVYSFDYGNTHFAVVRTIGDTAGTVDVRQQAWLEKDLAAARERGMGHLFVVGHAPGFPCAQADMGGGEDEEVNARRTAFWQLLSTAGVRAYLCAGGGSYARLLVDEKLVPGMSEAVWQIASGGAGAPFALEKTGVPWAGRIAAFTPQRHVCLYEVTGARVTLTVVDETGGTIERVDLNE